MGNWSPRVFTWPVERTNWALSAWNSTPDRNDVTSAWLYGQDHLWATGHLVSSPGGFHLDQNVLYRRPLVQI